ATVERILADKTQRFDFGDVGVEQHIRYSLIAQRLKKDQGLVVENGGCDDAVGLGLQRLACGILERSLIVLVKKESLDADVIVGPFRLGLACSCFREGPVFVGGRIGKQDKNT